MTDWISDGESGSSVRAKLNTLSQQIDSGVVDSSVASFTIDLPSGYRYFTIDMWGIACADAVPSISETELKARFSSDGGSTFYGDGGVLSPYFSGQSGSGSLAAIRIVGTMMVFPGNGDAQPSLCANSSVASAAVLSLFKATAVAIVDGGTGYSASDQISASIQNDASTTGNHYIIVDTVDGGGAVLTAHVDPSDGPAVGFLLNNPNPISTSGGGGSDCTVNLTWVDQVTVPINAVKFFSNSHNVTHAEWVLWGVM